MNNLLAQRKEIKRLEKESEKQRIEEEEDQRRVEEEARIRAVEEFEKVQIGLEKNVSGGTNKRDVRREDGEVDNKDENNGEPRGKKRRFKLDEEELLRIAKEERKKAKKAIQDEKVRFTEKPCPLFCTPTSC
jgi:nitric oxide synthase-interacting protein